MYIKKCILEGEHQQQDFKYEVSDAKKIARSLAAFANTDGGRLLVGVKDNGNIAGVHSEEEYYMVDMAAQLYTRPPVKISLQKHIIEGKTIIEVIIPPSVDKPHSAPDKNNQYKVYIRVNDQNLLANKVLLDVWKLQKENKGIFLNFSENEKFLLAYLKENENITISAFCKKKYISRKSAQRILARLIVLELISIHFTEKGTYYCLR